MALKKKYSEERTKRGARKKAEPLQAQPAKSQTFPVVGIGASAGGLEAFRQLLEHLPIDTGMAFILAQHLKLSTEPIYICDFDNDIVEWNQGCERLYGYTRAEAVGSNDNELLRTVYPLSFEEFSAQLTAQGEWTGDLRQTTKDGREVIVESCEKLTETNGRRLALVTNRDITERKRAEQALSEGEKRFRSAFEYAAIGMALVAPDGRFLQVNSAVPAMLGYSEAELLATDFQSLSHPDDMETDLAYVRAVLAGEIDTYQMEKRYIHKRGHTVWVLLSVSLLRDASGQPLYFISQFQNITEQKQALEALRESEARFRNMADNAPVIIWITEPDGVCTYVSQPWYEFTGQAPETGLGFGWVDALHPDDRELSRKAFIAANEKRETFWVEYRVRRRDGVYRWVIDSAKPRFGSQGEFLGYIGSVIDITETKQAELNTQFINRLDLAMCQLTDADEIIRLTTSKLGEYLGVARCRVGEKIPALSLIVVHENWEGWLHSAPSIAGEYHIGDFASLELHRQLETGEAVIVNDVTTDPRTRDFAHNYEPLGVGAFIVVPYLNEKRWETTLTVDQPQARNWRPDEVQLMRDVSVRLRLAVDRARTVEALRVSEARARRTMAEQMVAGVGECDLTGKFELVNQRFCEMIGYTKTELLEMRISDITHPDDWPHNAELNRRLIENGESFFIEKRYRRKDGSEVWGHVHASPIRNTRGAIVGGVAVVVDITDRKRAEQEREQLLEKEKAARAEAQAANQSKDEFLTLVSHELRSPLNSILGYARLLRAETANVAQIKHLVGIIERNGRIQLQLIEDLLDTARIISGKLELEVQPVDLVAVITTAIDVVRPAAQAKGISVISNLDSLAGQITGDPERLQQVVWNLLSNAIKFTPEGGRVEITLKRADPHIAIVVRDTGKGIEPDFLPHIFERFRQSDMSSTRRVGGLGLGLSLVKHLVELHGGTIEAESMGAGQGAIFTVRLPLRAVYTAPPEDRKVLATTLSAGAVSLAGLRALIVDDEEEVRTLLTLTLQSYGARAQAVASGKEALELLAGQTPDERFDALLCDIAMPEEDGYTVMRKVRSLPPDKGGAIPAIALTAYGRTEDRVRALHAGFQMHIAKPVEPDELAVVILSLIKRFDAEPGSQCQ